jgi:hypothetical protein
MHKNKKLKMALQNTLIQAVKLAVKGLLKMENLMVIGKLIMKMAL